MCAVRGQVPDSRRRTCLIPLRLHFAFKNRWLHEGQETYLLRREKGKVSVAKRESPAVNFKIISHGLPAGTHARTHARTHTRTHARTAWHDTTRNDFPVGLTPQISDFLLGWRFHAKVPTFFFSYKTSGMYAVRGQVPDSSHIAHSITGGGKDVPTVSPLTALFSQEQFNCDCKNTVINTTD